MKLVVVLSLAFVSAAFLLVGCGNTLSKEDYKKDPARDFQDKTSSRVNSYFADERTKIVEGFTLSNVRQTQIESMRLQFWERPEGIPVAEIEDYFRKIEVMNSDLPEMETWAKDVDVVSRVYLLHRQLDALSIGWATYFDPTIAKLKQAYLDYTACDDYKTDCYVAMAKKMIALVGEARKGDD